VPIVSHVQFAAAGIDPRGEQATNINGPSLIHVPDWVETVNRADPTAQYYLYFAHHESHFIRMAWSVAISGPYTLFNVGTERDSRVRGEGVLDLNKTLKSIAFKKCNDLAHNSTCTIGARFHGHIASPIVLVQGQQFVMYFHAKTNIDQSYYTVTAPFASNDQMTGIATSKTGLNFNNPDTACLGKDCLSAHLCPTLHVGSPSTRKWKVCGGVGGGEQGHGVKNAILGHPYFQPFYAHGDLFAFASKGTLWKAPNATEPWATSHPTRHAWEPGPNPIYDDLRAAYNPSGPRHHAGDPVAKVGSPRHFATRVFKTTNNGLHDDLTSFEAVEIFYTARGEAPERIFRTAYDANRFGSACCVSCSRNICRHFH
jgi:hypothetical protein